MAKRKKAGPPKVHSVPAQHPVPSDVPDCNRPLRDRGVSPGGLPPRGIQPGWMPLRGNGARYHTHS